MSWDARYNIAPTQNVPVIKQDAKGVNSASHTVEVGTYPFLGEGRDDGRSHDKCTGRNCSGCCLVPILCDSRHLSATKLVCRLLDWSLDSRICHLGDAEGVMVIASVAQWRVRLRLRLTSAPSSGA